MRIRDESDDIAVQGSPPASRFRPVRTKIPALAVGASVLFLILVVFLPALDMPHKATTASPEKRLAVLHAPIVQHVCSRILIAILLFVSLAVVAGCVRDFRSSDGQASSDTVERGFAVGLLLNSVLLGVWFVADAWSGWSTHHSTASEYARGFLVTTIFIAPLIGTVIYSVGAAGIRRLRRSRKCSQ